MATNVRIGYIKYPQFSKSHGAEFWTMQPDGKDNRREFIDTVGLIQDGGANILMVFHFDWSPEGRSVAWVRRTNSLWCEIIRRDLSAGTESTILSNSTLKTSLSWLTNGMIVYRSSGDDGAHLWAIPEDGGKPLQITRGTGAEEFPSASIDGSLLLFNGSRLSRDLWIGRLDGSDPEKVPYGAASASFSRSPSR